MAQKIVRDEFEQSYTNLHSVDSEKDLEDITVSTLAYSSPSTSS
jgi:hypothetical protein